jgi:hypothetical protein
MHRTPSRVEGGQMFRRNFLVAVAALACAALIIVNLRVGTPQTQKSGRQIFRFDTFGDQDFWGGTLQLHKAIEGADSEE